MKKNILYVFAIILFAVACKENKKKAPISAPITNAVIDSTMLPVASFDQVMYDFGTIEQGDVVETSFKVTNLGKSPLVISNARASCGCTIPKWPKEPIAPGESAKIDVKFNSKGKKNKIVKTVTLTTNTKRGREYVKIIGFIKVPN